MSSQDNTAGRHGSGKTADKVFKGVAYGCGILILVVLAAVALFLLFRAWPLIGGDQKANSATISNFTGGKATNFWQYVGPLLFGTVLVSALALLISFFIPVGIALFISHYAPKKLATVLSYVVDLLAAIPSVIYGLWGGLVLVPAIYPFWNWLSKTFGWIPIFAGPAANPSRTVATVSVVLAVMILPIITSMSRDIFLQTPRLQEYAFFNRTSLPGTIRKNFLGASSIKSERSNHSSRLNVMLCVPSSSRSGLLIASISSLSPSG